MPGTTHPKHSVTSEDLNSQDYLCFGETSYHYSLELKASQKSKGLGYPAAEA